MKEHKKNLRIDKGWALFLDRDGIINKIVEGSYVKKWSEFEFIPGFLKIAKNLTSFFSKIIVVTNQRGVAKELMTEADLEKVHEKMLSKIKDHGGKIDKIYFCPHNIEEKCGCRKPSPGMALKAKKEFKEIDFNRSIMLGDAPSDMEFGKSLGMTTVMIKKGVKNLDTSNADFVFSSLQSWLKFIKTTSKMQNRIHK